MNLNPTIEMSHVPMCLNCGDDEVAGAFSNEDGTGFCSAACELATGRTERCAADEDARREDDSLVYGDVYGDAEMARWDDDPDPYSGTYSEE